MVFISHRLIGPSMTSLFSIQIFLWLISFIYIFLSSCQCFKPWMRWLISQLDNLVEKTLRVSKPKIESGQGKVGRSDEVSRYLTLGVPCSCHRAWSGACWLPGGGLLGKHLHPSLVGNWALKSVPWRNSNPSSILQPAKSNPSGAMAKWPPVVVFHTQPNSNSRRHKPNEQKYVN